MRRMVWVLAGVILLAGAILVSQSGCRFYGKLTITDCDEIEERFLGRAPYSVCLRARGQEYPVQVYSWDLGDGTVGSENTISHTYTVPGEYEVTLEAIYENGSRDADEIVITVAGDPIAVFSYEPVNPNRSGAFAWFFNWFGGSGNSSGDYADSLTVEFDASESYPTQGNSKYKPQNLDWNFGDGTQETRHVSSWSGWFRSKDMEVVHDYAQAGTYTVTLTLTDVLGMTDTVSQTITVGPQGGEVDLDEGFELTALFWQIEDEDEEAGCLSVYGTIQNNNTVGADVELTARAYDGTGVLVGTSTAWASGTTNIGAGVNYPFGFFLCELSSPAELVVDVEVVVSGAMVR